MSDKVLENRLRRMAARRGLRLMKSRLRDTGAIGYGGYMVVGIDRNFVVFGAHPYSYAATLEDVEDFLTGAGAKAGASRKKVTKKRSK